MYRNTALLLLATGLLAGCSDSTAPLPAGTGRVELSIATAAGVGLAPGSESLTLGGNTLVIDRVRLVLREIELKRARGTDACPDGSGRSDDHCEKFIVGPVLVDLPLAAGPARMITIEADTGTYRELEFEIHKPEDDGGDLAFLQQHPDFARVSIRVEGSYNGVPFTFLSDLSADQEIDLVPPLVIREAATTNLTLTVDLREWFLSGGRTTFVNPATANKGGSNENLVKDNIRRSLEAFEDDNRDGRRG